MSAMPTPIECITAVCSNEFCLEAERPVVIEAIDNEWLDFGCWSCAGDLILRDMFNMADLARHTDSQPAAGVRTTKPKRART